MGQGGGKGGVGGTHVGPFRLVVAVEDLVQHVGRGGRLDGDAGQHALLVDVADQLARAGLEVRGCLGALGGSRVDGGFVVEAVEVAAGGLEFLDPFFGLWVVVSWADGGGWWIVNEKVYHLGNHHVAVKGAFAVALGWFGDVLADLGDHGRAECEVWDEVAVPGGWRQW